MKVVDLEGTNHQGRVTDWILGGEGQEGRLKDGSWSLICATSWMAMLLHKMGAR